jgi:hypothetical protein
MVQRLRLFVGFADRACFAVSPLRASIAFRRRTLMSLFGKPPRNGLGSLFENYVRNTPGALGGGPNALLGALTPPPPRQPAYGARNDGTLKGRGFLGEIRTPDGQVMTELSVGVDWGEGEQEIPAIVPGLTPQEIEHLRRGGQPTDAIVDKAIKHARKRRAQGLSPFATPGVDY